MYQRMSNETPVREDHSRILAMPRLLNSSRTPVFSHMFGSLSEIIMQNECTKLALASFENSHLFSIVHFKHDN